MRKIPYIYENPLDNFLIQLSENACPYVYSMGFTPSSFILQLFYQLYITLFENITPFEI